MHAWHDEALRSGLARRSEPQHGRWLRAALGSTLAFALLGAGCLGIGTSRPPGPAGSGCIDPKVEAGTLAKRIRFEHQGRTRTYYLHVPKGVDPARPSSLVLNFHGRNSSALEQLAYTQFNVTADARNVVVAYPEAVDAAWNGGDCCEPAVGDGIDDVGFARAVVQDVSSQVCVDSKRIYAAGFSNGAVLTHRLACEAPDLFAAAASVAGGLLLQGCSPKRAIPMLSIHGTADEVVLFSIAQGSTRSWQAFNGCGPRERTEGRCVFNAECRDETEVGLCTLPDVDHCWPGQALCPFGRSTSPLDFSSNVEIMRFFERHTRD